MPLPTSTYISMFLQVTGKFQGGVNPFTRGCCKNMEYLVCSPISPKYNFFFCTICICWQLCTFTDRCFFIHLSSSYTERSFKKTVVHVHPPFLRPELDRQMAAKVGDNGLQSLALQNKVCMNAEVFSHHLRIVTAVKLYHIWFFFFLVSNAQLKLWSCRTSNSWKLHHHCLLNQTAVCWKATLLPWTVQQNYTELW